jgi:hypothetical protein
MKGEEKPMFHSKCQIFQLLVFVTASFAAVPLVKAQIAQTIFVDPHPVVSGGTVGFAFAGDKFVGSVQGDGAGMLYQTGLDGGGVRLFAPQVILAGGNYASEHHVTSSPGLGGFPLWDIYVGSGTSVLHISRDGTKSDMFVTGISGPVQSIIFDTVGTYGHDMLVGTYAGTVYRINSAGVATLLANFSQFVEGMDIAPLGAGFGPWDGYLITVEENTGLVRAIPPSGGYIVLNPKTPIISPESLNFVPLNLGSSGSALEGYYEVNYTHNVLKADVSQFAQFKGDAIIASEIGSRTIWRMHWNGNDFDVIPIGEIPDQAEDSFFINPAFLAGTSCPPKQSDHNSDRNEWCRPFCREDGGDRPQPRGSRPN